MALRARELANGRIGSRSPELSNVTSLRQLLPNNAYYRDYRHSHSPNMARGGRKSSIVSSGRVRGDSDSDNDDLKGFAMYPSGNG